MDLENYIDRKWYDNQGDPTTPLIGVNFNDVVDRSFLCASYNVTDFTGKLNDTMCCYTCLDKIIVLI